MEVLLLSNLGQTILSKITLNLSSPHVGYKICNFLAKTLDSPRTHKKDAHTFFEQT